MAHSHHHHTSEHLHHDTVKETALDGARQGHLHAHIKESYDKHSGHHTEDFLKRFWICLILTIPVLALSHMIQQWFGFDLRFNGEKYLLLLLGSIIYFYGGMPFFKGMISEIKYYIARGILKKLKEKNLPL